MALVLNDEEAMLAESAAGFFRRSSPVAAFRVLRGSTDPVRRDAAVVREIAESGFLAPNLPEALGGFGMGLSAAALVAEEAGRNLVAAPLLPAAMAVALIVAADTKQTHRDLLAEIVAGRVVIAVALDETARHDPSALDTVARASTCGWALDGRKVFVAEGIAADFYLASAIIDGVPGLFLIEKDAGGLSIEPATTVDGRNHARLAFDSTPATRIGADAGSAIAVGLDVGRMMLSAELLGIASEAFDRTIAHLKEREQFGRRIGSFQALQHRVARLHGRLELARGVVLKALRATDDCASNATYLVSLAKSITTRLARDATADMLHLHGGIGMTDEFDGGLFFRRARVAGDMLGDDFFHSDRLMAEHWML